MLVCSKCGESSPRTARFCHACGATLGDTARLRKNITSLFCDLAGSTALAEMLSDPEAIHEVLSRYLLAMTKVIEGHGGVVEKFAGDAVLGTFGVPRSHEDDALRAVRAAIEMREALVGLNRELEIRWGVALQVKIGINSGEVLTGDTVSGQAIALGDPVNLAARLEQTAEPGEIVIGEATLRLVEDAVGVDAPRELTVKGKAGTIRAYRVKGLMPDMPSISRRFTRPMVDRTRELQGLRDAYRRAVGEERGVLLVLMGSAGIGKSLLVGAFQSEVEAEATVYAATCPSYGERSAFWPLAQVIRAHAGLRDSDGELEVQEKLRRVVGDVVEDRGERVWVLEGLGSLVGQVSAPRRPQDSLVSSWRRFLERLAASRPLVLVIEDLHWAEDALLEFVGSLNGNAGRILIVCTARPDLDERRIPGELAVLRLGPLDPAEIAAVVEARAGKALPADVGTNVIARAGGNPLFAEALVALILEGGRERVAEVPATVDAIVAARLDALSDDLRSILLDASVIGSSIPAEALRSMGELDTRRVSDGIDELVDRDLLLPAPEPARYEFSQELVRAVAYGQIPRANRSGKHRAFADWLERRDGDQAADLLAYHLGQALDIAVEARESQERRRSLAERAFRYRVLAAGRALRGADPGTASALLASAARTMHEIPGPDVGVVSEAGGLLVALGRWEDAIALLVPFTVSDRPPILRALGVALCKLHRQDPRGEEYRSGQAYLERAAAQGDADALSSLAGTWKGIDERKVRELYRQATEIDPADPYPLGNLVEYEVQAAGNLSPVEAMGDRLIASIDRCRRQIAADENLPWAHYDLGKFTLLQGEPYEALEAYAKAVDLSPASFMLETSLASLRRLSAVSEAVAGLPWCRDFLMLALDVFSLEQGPDEASVGESVVVFAGGTSSAEDSMRADHREEFVEAFRDFRGRIISGGTTLGVSGLAGDIGERHPHTVRTVGYVPSNVPSGVELDTRYQEVHRTAASSFSPLEPLTYWAELISAGIRPSNVKIVGMGGGRVAAAEFGIGLALGATLGVIRGSGRAADEILSDPHWSRTKRLMPLEADREGLRSFLSTA
jgi:class 3 adenylate cyclase/tetratricopeptide (TPR) repeat protein